MAKEIYLDYSATTYVDPLVKKAMNPFFTKDYGNPGSFNTAGLRVKKAVNKAREDVAKLLNARPREIIFTGSGTESVNLAIKGFARANKSKGKHIITSAVEHHAVLDTCKYLEKNEGFKITYLNVDKYGRVCVNDLRRAIRKDTILVSIMYANNEIGTINPIYQLAKVCRENDIVFHTDACQAGAYLSIDTKELNIDMMTLNGSKIYGPKGIGCLFVRTGIKLHPIVHGGGQEWGLRSGTENVPGIIGFSAALKLAQSMRKRESARLIKLRDKLIKGILSNIPKSFLNGHPTERLPNNVNVTLLNVEGEAVILRLNEFGICASTGSACTSKTLDPSHVIIATGLPYEAAHGSIRFTLGRDTTKKSINLVIKKLPEIVEDLRKLSPVNLNMKTVLENRRKNK